MTTVMAKTDGGLPKPNYVDSPFDSDNVAAATSSAQSRSRVSEPFSSSAVSSVPQSSGHSNPSAPFDSAATSGRGRVESHFATECRSETTEEKRGNSKLRHKELFGEAEPIQNSSQKSQLAHSDEARLADQSLEQLEQDGLNKSKGTTRRVKNATRIAEHTKGFAVKALELLLQRTLYCVVYLVSS